MWFILLYFILFTMAGKITEKLLIFHHYFVTFMEIV